MTRIYKLIIALTVVFAAASCSFLDVDEHGKSDTDSFFTDVDGLKVARIGLYSVTYDFCNMYLYKYAEVAGDGLNVSVVGSGADMYYQYNFLSTPDLESTAVGMIWKKGYVILTNANTILSYTDDLKKSYPSQKSTIEKIEGEACFFRAMAHFDLVRCYAQPYSYTSDASHIGIPVIDHVPGTKEKIARTSVANVYKQVIKDLTKAKSLLGEGAPADAHYVSGLACDALLARVYLYMGDYAQAEAFATKTIDGVKLTAHDKYEAMFTHEEIGDEAILRLSGYYAGKSLRTFYNYESPVYYPTGELAALFSSEDVRRKLLYAPDGSLACMKYYDLSGVATDEQYYDLSILRSSEMYLLRAEARCMAGSLDKAAEDVLAIQKRALNSTNLTLTYFNKNDLMALIKTERRKELCFEGQRFFDLARWGDNVVRSASTNSSMKELDYPDYRFALPIPLVEMEANGAMVQNEGYSAK